MLTHGGKDPSTIEAFNKALEMTDWKGQQKVVCAAQKALLASGEKVKVMSECAADAPAEIRRQACQGQQGRKRRWPWQKRWEKRCPWQRCQERR